MKTRNWMMVVGLAAGMGAGAMAGGQEVSYRIVAKTGDAAPGAPGSSFLYFGTPRLNDNGEVAFQAVLNAEVAPSGIWSEGQGGVGNAQLVVREGQQVPGVAQMTFGDFADGGFSYYGPLLNNNGNVAFGAPLIGSVLEGDTGVMREVGGTLERVAVPGQIAPGTTGFFNTISNLPSFSSSDAVAFRATLSGFQINGGNDTGIWTDAAGSLAVHMREGDIAPNTFNAEFTNFALVLPRINGTGDVSAMNYVELNGETRWSIYQGPTAASTLRVQEEWSTPLGISTSFEGSYYGFGDHSLNDSGDLLFPQTFDAFGQSESGLWLRRNGVMEAVAASGTLSPLGALYDNVDGSGHALNGNGDVSFIASVTGPAATDDAVYLKRAGQNAQVVFREGLQAPGLPGGVVLEQLWLSTINNRGQVALDAFLSGPGIHDGNDHAFFVTRATFGSRVLMREGQQIEVAPGDFRTVGSYGLIIGSGPETGRSQGLNFNGQAAFKVSFLDGTQAIVVSEAIVDCPGDFNGDLVIDFSDLNILLANYGEEVVAGTKGDVNLDGEVDFSDLNALLILFGTNCFPPV